MTEYDITPTEAHAFVMHALGAGPHWNLRYRAAIDMLGFEIVECSEQPEEGWCIAPPPISYTPGAWKTPAHIRRKET